MAKQLNTRIQLKHDTEENWKKATGFTPLIGEAIIYDPDDSHRYARIKVGDGKTSVVNLPFSGGAGSSANIVDGESTYSLTQASDNTDEARNSAVSSSTAAFGCGTSAGSKGFRIVGVASRVANNDDEKTGQFVLKDYYLQNWKLPLSEDDEYCVRISNMYDLQGVVKSVVKLSDYRGSLTFLTDSDYSDDDKLKMAVVTVTNFKTERKSDDKSNEAVSSNIVLDDTTGLVKGIGNEENYTHVDEYLTNSSDINSFRVHTKPLTGNLEIGRTAFATGLESKATGMFSFASGYASNAFGKYAHAEGNQTLAGYSAHSEGRGTKATGQTSHAEGTSTVASGHVSHAEGEFTEAKGARSHAEGLGTVTSVNGSHQHVQGTYNIEDTAGEYAHIVGNGDSSKRSNAHTLDWNGNAWFAGNITVGEKRTPIPTEARATYVSERSQNSQLIQASKVESDLGIVVKNSNEPCEFNYVANRWGYKGDNMAQVLLKSNFEAVDVSTTKQIGAWIYYAPPTDDTNSFYCSVEFSSSGKPDTNEIMFRPKLYEGWHLYRFDLNNPRESAENGYIGYHSFSNMPETDESIKQVYKNINFIRVHSINKNSESSNSWDENLNGEFSLYLGSVFVLNEKTRTTVKTITELTTLAGVNWNSSNLTPYTGVYNFTDVAKIIDFTDNHIVQVVFDSIEDNNNYAADIYTNGDKYSMNLYAITPPETGSTVKCSLVCFNMEV